MEKFEVSPSQLVGEYLVGKSCQDSIESALDELGLDENLANNQQFLDGVDNYAILCQECNWWVEPINIHDHPKTGEFICEDCLNTILD